MVEDVFQIEWNREQNRNIYCVTRPWLGDDAMNGIGCCLSTATNYTEGGGAGCAGWMDEWIKTGRNTLHAMLRP